MVPQLTNAKRQKGVKITIYTSYTHLHTATFRYIHRSPGIVRGNESTCLKARSILGSEEINVYMSNTYQECISNLCPISSFQISAFALSTFSGGALNKLGCFLLRGKFRTESDGLRSDRNPGRHPRHLHFRSFQSGKLHSATQDVYALCALCLSAFQNKNNNKPQHSHMDRSVKYT